MNAGADLVGIVGEADELGEGTDDAVGEGVGDGGVGFERAAQTDGPEWRRPSKPRLEGGAASLAEGDASCLIYRRRRAFWTDPTAPCSLRRLSIKALGLPHTSPVRHPTESPRRSRAHRRHAAQTSTSKSPTRLDSSPLEAGAALNPTRVRELGKREFRVAPDHESPTLSSLPPSTLASQIPIGSACLDAIVHPCLNVDLSRAPTGRNTPLSPMTYTLFLRAAGERAFPPLRLRDLIEPQRL